MSEQGNLSGQGNETSKRIRRRWIILAAVLFFGVIVAAFAAVIYGNRAEILTSELKDFAGSFEAKTGLLLSYGDFKINRNSLATLDDIVVRAPGAAGPVIVAEARRVEVAFDSVAGLSSASLRSITLIRPEAHLRLLPDGGLDLPEKTLALVHRAQAGEQECAAEKKSGGFFDGLLSDLLSLEIKARDGSMEVLDERSAKSPRRTRLESIEGQATLDLYRRRVAAQIAGRQEGGAGAFVANLELSREKRKIDIVGRPLSLAFLAPYSTEKLRFQPDSRLMGRVGLSETPGSKVLEAVFNAEVSGLTLADPRLAPGPIRNVRLRADGELTADLARRLFELKRTRLPLGSSAALLSGKLSLPREGKAALTLDASAKDLSIQAFLDAMPPDFAPTLQGARVEGTLDFNLQLNLDFARPAEASLTPDVTVRNFRVTRPPPLADIGILALPFDHQVFKDGVYVTTVRVSDGSPDFVPFDKLGPMIIGAVLTCEDGRFFSHHGIVLKHILESIKDDMRKEGFVRGGSTVSMQTVKNLFLGPEKTASRKFQEMLLTWWLEQALPKNRILEIYMNIIEWGPELYGIGPACRHYFGKAPSDLSPLQAAFLGSIIKNPVRYHGFRQRGFVSDGWSTLLDFILRKMAERGTITPETAEACDPYQPAFSMTGNPAPGGCAGESAAETSGATANAIKPGADEDEPIPIPVNDDLPPDKEKKVDRIE